MTTLAWTLTVIGCSAVWWRIGRDVGHNEGWMECHEALTRDMERWRKSEWDRFMAQRREIRRPPPLLRPDASRVDYETLDELAFRLVDDGIRLMEGEG